MRQSARTIHFAILLILFVVTNVFAQSVAVLGEIRSRGSVFIESSTGKWVPAQPTYPLLETTAVRTEQGLAMIVYADGSRIDLGRETAAGLGREAGSYHVSLAKGTITFGISPSASCTVKTPSALVSINAKQGLIQKVSVEKPQRAAGMITATEKGTEIQATSGQIVVRTSPTASKVVAAGESVFVGADQQVKVYKTQAVTPPVLAAAPLTTGQVFAIAAITTTFVASGTAVGVMVSNDNKDHRIASPSGF